jgi:aromatic-L-amino-acid decarboxylase
MRCGMDSDEFRRVGKQLIDWIADHRDRLESLPVRATVQPGETLAALPAEAPEMPEGLAGAMADLDRVVMPGLTHWNHPGFYGFFPANAELSSILGDLVSSGLGVVGLSWEASPALTEVEQRVLEWMRILLGLPEGFHGVIQDTASTSTLVALLCARERSTEHGQARGGLQAAARPLVVYCSREAHSSVGKAALLAGFGRDNLRLIDTDENLAMRPEALEDAIRADLAAGLQPSAVVATVGTTATTAIDPVGELARIATQHNLWLHVDAALAGSAMIAPEFRFLWSGIEGADSLVVNAHKWLGVVFDCSLYFVRDPEHLTRVMSTNPSYLRSAHDEKVANLRDWGIPLGRRFRALKLWFLLREKGAAALRERIRRDVENARWLAERVDETPDWRRLAPVPLQTLCVRHEPAGLGGEALDEHTLGWVRRVNATGRAYLTPALLHGRWMARVSVGALPTERRHIEDLWMTMQDAARAG